jgi:hypothetical protein
MANGAQQRLSVGRPFHSKNRGVASGGEGPKCGQECAIGVGRMWQVSDREIDRSWIDPGKCEGLFTIDGVDDDASLVLELAVKQLAQHRIRFYEQYEWMCGHESSRVWGRDRVEQGSDQYRGGAR